MVNYDYSGRTDRYAKILISDGALGTMLQSKGLKPG